MLDRIEAGVAEQRRLVADASHELRTPLAAMRAELDVSLRADDLDRRRARTVLESTREEVDRMSATVDNLLTLARADEGRLDAARRAARPARARGRARPSRSSARPRARGRPDARRRDGGARGAATRDRLRHALRNLVENAIKFTPGRRRGRGVARGAATARRASRSPTTARASRPSAADRVFDRFFRVDAARARATGGSGLGLAICDEIAEAHGGRVTVRQHLPCGSVFTFRVPSESGT